MQLPTMSAALGLNQVNVCPHALTESHCLCLLTCSWAACAFPYCWPYTYAFGRDGVRRGCIRAPTGQQVLASARAALPFSIASTLAVSALYFQLTRGSVGTDTAEPHAYLQACLLYLAALLVEACAEPWFVLVTFRGHIAAETAIEITARVADALMFWASVSLPQVRSLLFWRCLVCVAHCHWHGWTLNNSVQNMFQTSGTIAAIASSVRLACKLATRVLRGRVLETSVGWVQVQSSAAVAFARGQLTYAVVYASLLGLWTLVRPLGRPQAGPKHPEPQLQQHKRKEHEQCAPEDAATSGADDAAAANSAAASQMK